MVAKKNIVQAEPLDVGAAQQAYEQVLPELEQITDGSLLPVRSDLQLSSAVAYSVAVRDSAEPRRSRLAMIAQGNVFTLTVLDRIPLLALATWHVRRKQVEAVEAASKARIVEATLKEAQITRRRMLKVLSHYFEDHPDFGKRITAIRAGTGYLDLANDLLAVADLYQLQDVNVIVSLDPMHYRADDPTHARALAQEIFLALGLTPEGEASLWTDLAQRAWTLLSQNYDSLSAAGRLVFRNEEDVDESYPSLVAAVRTPATRVNPAPVAPTSSPQPVSGESTK
jgi:hypothetical protein